MYVTPETVARWHHAGFRLYWGWLSRHDHALGRKRISKQVRDLIFQMVAENHTWGAPHIHGELLKLGSIFRNAPCPAGCNERRRIQNWHDAGKHSFTIVVKRLQRWISSQCPTITFGVLHCFFVISHNRRQILHFNVTRHPTSLWITQQLREAFPYDTTSKYLICDRDAKFGEQVSQAVTALALQPVSTSSAAPGKTALPSDGSEPAAGISWIT
jgi:hypothetical protein